MTIIISFIERLFVFAFLAIFAGIFWPPNAFMSDKAVPEGVSNTYDFTAFSVLAAFLVVVIFVRRAELGRLARSAWPVLALCGLAFLSAFWADDPALVIRRSGTLTMTTLFGIYLVARGDMAALVRMLVRVYAAAALASLFLIVVAPQVGTTAAGAMYAHSWQGAFTDKNGLGLACAVGILFSVYAFATGQGSRWLSAFTIASSLLLLYGSESKTPVVVLMAAFYAGMIGTVLRRRSGLALATGFALIVIGLIGAGGIALGWDAVLAALGRDPTFTNRTKLWHYALVFIAHRPWLGYGFGDFWRYNGVEANEFWALVEFRTPHAHNAWLELGLRLGVVGIAGGVLAWIVALYRAARTLFLSQIHVALCLALLAGIFLENLTEYEFLRQGDMLWVLFVAVSTYLGNELLASHPARRGAAATVASGKPVFGGLVGQRPR